ncbi:MAG TPA: hypothetical protein VGL55_04800 [Steroidobacteraceae bacterium]|jgi:hypothetical protein
MPALSQWLQIMLAEIVRKREAELRSREEECKRETEKAAQGKPGEAHDPQKR